MLQPTSWIPTLKLEAQPARAPRTLAEERREFDLLMTSLTAAAAAAGAARAKVTLAFASYAVENRSGVSLDQLVECEARERAHVQAQQRVNAFLRSLFG